MISSSSSSSSSSSNLFDYTNDIVVAMACREYGNGRVFIHTDRMGAFKTGHKDNSNEFWRKILEWSGNKNPNETIRVGLIINVQPSNADHMNSFKPISVKKIKLSDLPKEDFSKYDCLYFVGLPNLVANTVASKISTFVSNGGGLIIEYPNQTAQPINLLRDIETVYCYSSDRLIKTNAFWTIDGGNHYVHDNNAVISFMSTLRRSDFSGVWTILMTNVQNEVPDDGDTDDNTDGLIYDKKSSASFTVSYLTMMQNGIAVLEWGNDFTSSSSSSSSESSDSSSSSSSI